MSDSAVPATANPVGVAALGGVLSVTQNALSLVILCIFSAVVAAPALPALARAFCGCR